MPTTPVLVERLARSPRALFLVDGVGALVTALLVGVVLPTLGEHIGTPRPVLRALALTAAVFAAYSLTCAATRPTRWPGYLRGIALANAGYCLVTAALLIRFSATLQALDWLYFVGEIVVVCALVTLELRVARAAATEGPALTARAPLTRKDHGGATW
jgi:FtsH-binding integral membrane protein